MKRDTQKRFNLCPECNECPELVIRKDDVRIGEKGNMVVLKKEEWEELKRVIKEL